MQKFSAPPVEDVKINGARILTIGEKPKDNWDKAEVLSKVAGSVLVPIVVAIAVFAWNSERTKQQTAASIMPLAISILTTAPTDDDTTALREWAISVLNDPSDPPALTGKAARSLSAVGLKFPALPEVFIESCERPVPIPPEADTQSEQEALWRRDRINLANCADRHEALAQWNIDIAQVFSREKN